MPFAETSQSSFYPTIPTNDLDDLREWHKTQTFKELKFRPNFYRVAQSYA